MKSLPFTPERVEKERMHYIPNEMIDAINSLLISAKQVDGSIIISHKEIELKFKKLYTGKINLSWYDFESLYEKYNWKVTYTGSGYGDSYDAYYTFTPLLLYNLHNKVYLW